MAPAGAEAAAWGSTRPLWMRLSASGSDCEVLQGTHRARQRQEKQAERENEAEMRSDDLDSTDGILYVHTALESKQCVGKQMVGIHFFLSGAIHG